MRIRVLFPRAYLHHSHSTVTKIDNKTKQHAFNTLPLLIL